MIQTALLFSLLSICLSIHLQQQLIVNETIRNVLNAACPAPPKLYISNPEAPNWIFGGSTPQQYLSQIQQQKKNHTLHKCPLDKPFAVDNECVTCPQEQFFNLTSKDCEQCPGSLYYSPKQRACTLNPPLLMNANIQSGNNYIGTPPNYDPSVKTCPKQTPFTNKTDCFDCQLPRYYNYNQMECQSCPNDQSFNINQKRCSNNVLQPIQTSPNPNYQKRVVAKQTSYSTITPVAVMPIIVKDLNNPSSSISNNFNNQLSNSINTSYSRITQSKNNSPNQLYPITSNQSCPNNRPYFNGQQCISCPSAYPLFDSSKKQCISCPHNRIFDFKNKRCIEKVDITPSIQRFLMNIK